MFSDDKFEIRITSKDRVPALSIVLFMASIFLFLLMAAVIFTQVTQQDSLSDALHHINYNLFGGGCLLFVLVEYIFLSVHYKRKGRRRIEINEHEIKIYASGSKTPKHSIQLDHIQAYKKINSDWSGIMGSLMYWPNNTGSTSIKITYRDEQGGKHAVRFKGLSNAYASWLDTLIDQLKNGSESAEPIAETRENDDFDEVFPKISFVKNCRQYVPSLAYAPIDKLIEKEDCVVFRMKAQEDHARLCTYGGGILFFISGLFFSYIESLQVNPIAFIFGFIFGCASCWLIYAGLNNRSKRYDFALYYDHLEVTPKWFFFIPERTKRLNYGASLVSDLETGDRIASGDSEICVDQLGHTEKNWLHRLIAELNTPNAHRDLTRFDENHSMDDLYHSLEALSTGYFKTENREGDGFTASAPYGPTYVFAPFMGALACAAGIYLPAWFMMDFLPSDMMEVIFSKAMLSVAWVVLVCVLADGILYGYNDMKRRRNKKVVLTVTSDACLVRSYNQKMLIGLNPTFDGVPGGYDNVLDISSDLGRYLFKIPDETSRALIRGLLTNIRYPAWSTDEQKAELAAVKAKKEKAAIEREALKRNFYGQFDQQTNWQPVQQAQNPRALFVQHLKSYINVPYPVVEKPEIFPVLAQPMVLKKASAPVPHYSALDGKYNDLVPIGTGAQGTMFRALDINRRPVGIKVYDFMRAQDWKSSELFEREVKTLQHLHFQGIPKFIELIDANPQYFLVESFIAAPSMALRMRQGYRPSLEQAIQTLRNIAEILNYLQTRQPAVIHRDIKPENLLVDDNANVWLVDFGVVAAEVQKTNAMTFAGTAGYMAPEQLMGKVTPAADIYAAGVTMIAYISGKSPLDMEMRNLAIAVEKVLPPTIPEWLSWLLTCMTNPEPQKRIQSSAQILHMIDHYTNKTNRPNAQPYQSYQANRLPQQNQGYSTYAH